MLESFVSMSTFLPSIMGAWRVLVPRLWSRWQWLFGYAGFVQSQSSTNGKKRQTPISYITRYFVFRILVSKLCLLWQWQHCQFWELCLRISSCFNAWRFSRASLDFEDIVKILIWVGNSGKDWRSSTLLLNSTEAWWPNVWGMAGYTALLFGPQMVAKWAWNYSWKSFLKRDQLKRKSDLPTFNVQGIC